MYNRGPSSPLCASQWMGSTAAEKSGRSTPESKVGLHDLVESRDKRLRKPEGKRQLRPGHEQLRHQSLEERRKPLLPRHIPNDLDTRLLDFEVLILYPRLNHIQGRRHNKRRRRSHHRSHKILEPARLVVILQLKEILLRGRGTTEQRKRARRIACSRPSPASIQSEALIGDDPKHASAAESFWVCLPFDLKDIQR